MFSRTKSLLELFPDSDKRIWKGLFKKPPKNPFLKKKKKKKKKKIRYRTLIRYFIK